MCKKNCFLNSNVIGNRKIIIWGAGVRGKEMHGLLSSYGYEIKGFVDSYVGGGQRRDSMRSACIWGRIFRWKTRFPFRVSFHGAIL